MPAIVLSNVTFNWCSFSKLDQFGKYGCQILLNKTQADKLKGMGLKSIKKDESGSYVLRVRRPEDKGPVIVTDMEKNTVTCNPSNGAIGDAIIDVYPYKRYGGGITSRLEKVRLKSYTPYGEDVDFEDEEETEERESEVTATEEEEPPF